MNAETAKLLIESIATIIGIILTAYVVPWLKQKVDGDKLEKIREYTEIAVRCAEQIFSKDEYKEKKQYVYQYILEKAGAIGIDLSAGEVDLLVEGVVNAVKHGGD